MKKIAFVINYIVKNGPSSVVLNLINNLYESTYNIYLITLFDGNDIEVVSSLREQGVFVYECTTLSRMNCLLGKNREFKDIINKESFDILHTNGIIPDILSSRLQTSTKRITTIHNNMWEDYLTTYGHIKSSIMIKLHLSALKKLDECVCCSKSVFDVMKHKLDNVSFVRNGIEPLEIKTDLTRKELDIPLNARVFLYAGVLNSRKNIEWLIKKFVQYHDENEYLLVLGHGEKEAECKQQADNHVRMLGFQSNPISYMNISDVYASASKSEGFSISVLEALSCGLLLFLSDIPSHREIVNMNSSVYLGEIFKSMDFEKKMKILRTKQLNKDQIRKFQNEALSAKTMTEGYRKIYEKI